MDQPPIIRAESPNVCIWLGYSDSSARIWFYGAILTLCLASVMRVGERRSVYLPGLSIPIAETCFSRRYFGVDCPGCGLTRTFIHLMHGNFEKALHLNAVGALIFVFTAAQIPLGFFQIFLHRRGAVTRAWQVWNERWLAFFAVTLTIQWLIRYVLEARF